ncbi:unnamed protein product, partial [Meganyctiphanes norvegica]
DSNVENHIPEGRVYESPGDRLCPVSTYEAYDALWQCPNVNYWKEGSAWFCAQPIGCHYLSVMKPMSVDAPLNRIYTNHCVRAKTIRILASASVQRSDIKVITGHKRESSLDPYITVALVSTSSMKRKLSNIVSNAVREADNKGNRRMVDINKDEEL